MYRQHALPKKPPTVIEYRTRWFRPWLLVMGLALFVGGVMAIGGHHATKLSCARVDDERGSCHVRRYALVGSLDIDVFADHIAALDVRIRTGSKGGKFANVYLVTTPSSGYGVVAVESGVWGDLHPERAFDARARVDAFRAGRIQGFEMWLTPNRNTVVLMLVGLMLAGFGGMVLREQIRQIRSIRIVVDHEREVVILAQHEVPFNEIDGVTVELGRAHYWSSGKNEYITGHRVVVVRRFGDDVPATKDFRAGDHRVHDEARVALLCALGRDASDSGSPTSRGPRPI